MSKSKKKDKRKGKKKARNNKAKKVLRLADALPASEISTDFEAAPSVLVIHAAASDTFNGSYPF